MPVNRAAKGFTLVEMVIGIIVFGIALTLITSLLLPQSGRSIDPIYQARATELAQSLLNEISAKSFDENSDRSGGSLRCGEDMNGDGSVESCSMPAALGLDSTESCSDRDSFDDVDDYFCISNQDAVTLLDTPDRPMNSSLQPLYQGFLVSVSGFYDSDLNGTDDGSISQLKLIRVSVTTPNDETLEFATYRGNY
ncbi:type II secretion system protein [Lacimicrobium sp. SS2-24]|uniref:type IV pilus modification PilV family protein n=1 Tax=Lacimicrobium sp. SS2-24 TaxID=2005569 RepID=UPI000B4AEFBC|nr:type II secretion system protein [Lacimicrobium sp. SS2-24]